MADERVIVAVWRGVKTAFDRTFKLVANIAMQARAYRSDSKLNHQVTELICRL